LHTLIGHEDWIRDIDVCQTNDHTLLIASSSQDNFIRLWKLESTSVEKKEDLSTNIIIEEDSVKSIEDVVKMADKMGIKKGKDDDDEEEEDDESIKKNPDVIEEELKLKSSLFTVHSKHLNKDEYVNYSINLDSVLYGHEDWIYTVKFHPRILDRQPLILLSASMDKTLVIWKYDEENSIWIDSARAGDIGGTTLGFYGANFEPNGKYIVAHGYQGALHLWQRRIDANDSSSRTESLIPSIINGGHFDLVEDLCWEPDQEFFLSVSKDQTTRFHGYWSHSDSSVEKTWHELGRPQIHGYDISCLSMIDRFKFVSGADEKLLRIFEAPKIFLKNFYNLSLNESVAKLIKVKNKFKKISI
jgi:WD40 repeat protein